jgi:plasmid stability protein
MSTMIQVRNVPEELHRRLKARAALEGVSMSEFILREIRSALERPTRAEVLERIAELPEVYLPSPAAEVVRRERDSR